MWERIRQGHERGGLDAGLELPAREELLHAGHDHRQGHEGAPGHEGRQERLLRRRHDLSVPQRRQRRREQGEHAEGEQPHPQDDRDEVALEQGQLADREGACGLSGDPEDPQGRQLNHPSVEPREHLRHQVEQLDEPLFARHGDAHGARQNAEERHRGDQSARQGSEGVAGNVELLVILSRRALQRARAVEGAHLPGGEREREQGQGQEPCQPEEAERAAGAPDKPATTGARQLRDVRHKGDHHVRQDRHLQQAHVRVPKPLPRGRELPKKEARCHAQGSPQEHPLREAQPPSLLAVLHVREPRAAGAQVRRWPVRSNHSNSRVDGAAWRLRGPDSPRPGDSELHHRPPVGRRPRRSPPRPA